MKRRPNIVFVIIDSLRHDRLGSSGYRPAVTPTLDRLVESGASCEANFSVGCPTQVAFPAIWTSTLPLDHGGYTDGIDTRPDMLPEHLQGAGYETFGITTGHPSSSHFGYDRGFDEFIDLIDLHQWFRSQYIAVIGDWIEQWRNGEIPDHQVEDLIREQYGRILQDTLRFLDKLDQIDAPERTIRRNEWRDRTIQEQGLLERETAAIVRKLSVLARDYDLALGEPEISAAFRKRYERKKRFEALANRWLLLTSRRWAYSSYDVNRLAKSFLAERNRDKPYFLYVHYFDLHEHKLLIPNLTFRRAVRIPGDLYSARNRKSNEGGLMYDIVLRDMDRQLAVLLDMIERQGDPENTILVVTGDHGTSAGMPYRPYGHDLERMFYDNFTHVPLIVSGPGIAAQKIDRIQSHLDLAPTVLDVAGCDIPRGMRGASIFDNEVPRKDFILAETGGNGRCEILYKSLFLSVRTQQLKCIFRSENNQLCEMEVYDLLVDPMEQKNLSATEAHPSERKRLKSIAAERLGAIGVPVQL